MSWTLMQLDKGSFSFSQTNQAALAQNVCDSYKNEELLKKFFRTPSLWSKWQFVILSLPTYKMYEDMNSIFYMKTKSYLIFHMKINFTNTLHRAKEVTELLINFLNQAFQRV